MKVVFDIRQMKPGCALLQAALGGTEGIANVFPAEAWLIAPTDDLKVYEVNECQLNQLIEKVELRSRQHAVS